MAVKLIKLSDWLKNVLEETFDPIELIKNPDI
jgi:hypothetical protein